MNYLKSFRIFFVLLFAIGLVCGAKSPAQAQLSMYSVGGEVNITPKPLKSGTTNVASIDFGGWLIRNRPDGPPHIGIIMQVVVDGVEDHRYWFEAGAPPFGNPFAGTWEKTLTSGGHTVVINYKSVVATGFFPDGYPSAWNQIGSLSGTTTQYYNIP